MTTNTSRPTADADVVKKITDFLADELAEVGRILAEYLETESEIIREVGDYLAITPGKKLRPMLNLLMARALAPDRPAPVEVAASLEFVHVATLLHDDVIDQAETRRGRASVNARWGADVAILMADFLYAGSFDLALSTLKPEVLRMVCGVSRKMCEGEMLQIKLRNRTYSTADYIDVVGSKTASLFSACTALGAHVAGADEATAARARQFGYDFGIAFQITDDVLDFTANPEQLGKEIGMDLLGGKQTLPLLLALDEANDKDRALMERWLHRGAKNGNGASVLPVIDLAEVLETVERYKGIERALNKAREFAARAERALDKLPVRDAEAYEYLAALPQYVLSRTF